MYSEKSTEGEYEVLVFPITLHQLQWMWLKSWFIHHLIGAFIITVSMWHFSSSIWCISLPYTACVWVCDPANQIFSNQWFTELFCKMNTYKWKMIHFLFRFVSRAMSGGEQFYTTPFCCTYFNHMVCGIVEKRLISVALGCISHWNLVYHNITTTC